MSDHTEAVTEARDWLDALNYGYFDATGPVIRAARLMSDLLAAYDGLWTWDGLLSILDKHYPADIFPTLPDRVDRDPGPRIVSLIRALSAAVAERDRLAAAGERVREALDRVALDHRFTGEPTSPSYQGAADYIRAYLDGPTEDTGSGDPS